MQRLLPSAIAAFALAVCATPSGAAQFAGAADDPANGALPGGRDIVRSEATYDDAAGSLTLRLTLREAPSASDIVATAFGTRNAAGACEHPAGIFAGATGGSYAVVNWSRTDAAGTELARGLDGIRTPAGAVVTYAVANAGFAGQGYNCLDSIRLVDGVDTRIVYEQVAGYSLTPVAVPPPPAPPAPAPPAPAPVPAPRTTTTPPPPPARRAPVKKVARLAAGVVGTPTPTVTKGRWATLKLRVVNGGTAGARKTTLTVSGSRGVAVRVAGAPRKRPGTRALKTLRAGKASTVTVRVRATRAGTVRFRATAAGRVSARGSVALKLKGKSKPKPSPRRGVAPRPVVRHPLADRYFWGTESDPMYAWRNHAVWFLDDRWAYYGFPPAGRPTCTAETTATDEDGRPTDEGCRPFTYDAKSGALTVGGLSGRLDRDDNIRLGELDFYWELSIPRAGTRIDVDLEHRGFSGMCGLIMGCTTWHYLIALRADGSFMRSNSATTTMGDGTSTPFVWGSNMPPDKTGRYEILAGGAIRFSYLDGRVATETIGIERARDGRADPAGRGIVVGDTNYYPDDDD